MKYSQGVTLIVLFQWLLGVAVASADETRNVIDHIGDALGARDVCPSLEMDLPNIRSTAEVYGVDLTPGSPASVRIGQLEISVMMNYRDKADKAFCDKMLGWYGPQGMKFLKVKAQN